MKYFAIIMMLASAAASSDDPVALPIVNGQDAPTGMFPWMVYVNSFLYDDQNNLIDWEACGGSLIAPNVFITAAHCAEGGTDWSHEVYIGAHTVTTNDLPTVFSNEGASWTPERHVVKAVIVHPDYDETTLYNDLSLMVLDTPSELPPIKIAASPPARGDKLTVVGWGLMDRDVWDPDQEICEYDADFDGARDAPGGTVFTGNSASVCSTGEKGYLDDRKLTCYASPAACWEACEATHGDDLVAVDWSMFGCDCATSCECTETAGGIAFQLLTRADLTLPGACPAVDDDGDDADDYYYDDAADGSGTPDILQLTNVEVLNPVACGLLFNEGYEICAGNNPDAGVDNTDNGHGDSGGPLFSADESGEHQLVGVVSRGIGAAWLPGGVYAEPHAYADWIDEVLADHKLDRVTCPDEGAASYCDCDSESDCLLAPANCACDLAQGPSCCNYPPCEDSKIWHKKKDASKDCAWVAEHPPRCEAKGVLEGTRGNVKAKFACPAACGTPCYDSTSWYTNRDVTKNCLWVSNAPSLRCTKTGAFPDDVDDEMEAWRACPAACAGIPI